MRYSLTQDVGHPVGMIISYNGEYPRTDFHSYLGNYMACD